MTSSKLFDTHKSVNATLSSDIHSEDLIIPNEIKFENENKNVIREIVLSFAYPMEFVYEIPATRNIGTWYLTPEHHILESWIMSMVAILILIISNTITQKMQQLSQKKKYLIPTQNNTTKYIKYRPSLVKEQTFTEQMMKYLLAIDYIIHIYFKSKAEPTGRGSWWLLQPCAVNHLLITFFLWNPLYLTNTILLYLITLSCGALNAILFPDMTEMGFLEKKHFWFQHLSILILPYYWLIKNAKLMDQISIWYAVGGHAALMLYCFIILELCSMISGVNLNYCLSPPNSKILTRHGSKYRIFMAFYMLFGHLFCGYLIPNIILIMVMISMNH